MSKKIIGVTVGTPMSPSFLKDNLNPVTSINGVTADENGNVEITIPDSGGDGADAIPPLFGSTDEITPSQVFQALIKGQQVILSLTAEGNNYLFTSFNIAGSSDAYSAMIFSTIVGLTGDVNRPQCDVVMVVGSAEGRTWNVMHQQLPVMADVPTDEYIKSLIEAELKNHPGSGGNVAYDEAQNLTEEQKARARDNIGAQPAGSYLTEVPDGYAKTEDVPTDAEIIQLIKDNAPGPSGGGIAVTGATVGQTVKISAVDENGVPTAWESVDFPSDEHINGLINTALGVIENGTY